jgi:heat shock protein HslJ
MAEIELAGTTWRAASIDESSVPDDDPPTIAFDDERVGGSTGVNRFTGAWELLDGVLVLSPLATTRMAGPPERMELERRFPAVVEGRCAVLLEGDMLTLRSDGGSLELKAENPDAT